MECTVEEVAKGSVVHVHSQTGEERSVEVAIGEVMEYLHPVIGEERRMDVAAGEEVMEHLHSVTGVEQRAATATIYGSVECSHSTGRKGKVLSNVRNTYSTVEAFGAYNALKSGYLRVSNTQEIWSRLVCMLPACKPRRRNHRLRTPEVDWGRIACRYMFHTTYRYL